MLTAQANPALIKSLHWRLWICQSVLLALLTPAFTFWSQAIFALLLLAKLDQLYFNRPVWGLGRSNLLAALIIGVLMLMVKQLGVIHLMFHFLLLAAVLRLLSIRSLDMADYRQLLWVQYFLIASCFIVHQNFAIAVWIFLLLAFQIQIQFYLFAGKIHALPWAKLLGMAVVFVPLLVSLFLFFPRLAPLWQLPGAKAAETGLANEISPGSIEKLVASDQLAFRVTFTGAPPKQSELYWRAKIYSTFDGSTWRSERPQRGQQPMMTATTWQYSIIAEPHHQRALFSLGTSMIEQGQVQLTADSLVRAVQTVSQRTSYQLSSANGPVPGANGQKLTPLEQTQYIQLPPGNPQTRAFASQLVTQQPPQQLVDRLAAHFRQADYQYTLSPKALTGDEIDQFMFQTKAGFCSHYASATTFILRAAGIPARIVGGYLGGEWLDNRQYLQVKQRDAHAWVEFYQQGYWYRFDPTAVVAPDRLENGLDSVLAANELSLLQQPWVRNFDLTQFILRKLDDLDFYWSKWIISFNEQQQQGLLQELKNSWQELTLPQIGKIIAATLAVGGCVLLINWWQQRAVVSAPVMFYQPLQRFLAKRPEESYYQYLQRFSQHYPDSRPTCEQLANTYQLWVFTNDADAAKKSRRHMRQLIQQLNR